MPSENETVPGDQNAEDHLANPSNTSALDTARIPQEGTAERKAGPYAADLEAAVFGYSEITAHIWTQAKILMVSPWSLLGTCLGQAAIATPYDVLLPPVIGTPASVNQLMVGVGASGAGKGISSARVLNWPDTDPFDLGDGEQRLADAFTPLTPGSGEALSALFKESRTVKVDGRSVTVQEYIRRAAWVTFHEVDQLTAIKSRVGSTATAEIRKAWSGEPLGTLTKVKANQLMVEAHTYRVVIVVAAQPGRCGPLLEEEAGGTPQRVLWLSADDPDMELRDEQPSTLDVTLPDFHAGISSPGPRYFTVDPAVRQEIRQDRVAGKWKGTVDSHRNLVRLKVAAAGAVLHGSIDIAPEIWEWAGAVVLHSVRVRESVTEELAKAAQEASTQRAASAAHEEIVKASAVELTVDKVAKAVERAMRRFPEARHTEGWIGSKVARVHRSLVPKALLVLTQRGTVVATDDTTRKGSTVYKLVAP